MNEPRDPSPTLNLILFESAEIARPLPRSDPRARHLLDVLRRKPGDTFDAGLIDGPRGKGTLLDVGAGALTLSFQWDGSPSPLPPITLLIGLPRPQTARDILRDATTLGVAAMHFVSTEKGERSYARSTLWTSGEWRRHLIAGAEQAFDTRLPEVTHGRRLLEVLSLVPADAIRLALDNYEAETALSTRLSDDGAIPCSGRNKEPHVVALAFGPERGWADVERAALRSAGFTLVHLGPRVLRTETAVIAAVSLARAKLGLM